MNQSLFKALSAKKTVKTFTLIAFLFNLIIVNATDTRFNNEAYYLYIEEINANILRISLVDSRQTLDELNNSPVLAEKDRKIFQFSESSRYDVEELHFSGLDLEISYSPLTLLIRDKEGKLLQEFVYAPYNGKIEFQPGKKNLFGLGQVGMDYNREGNFHPMDPGTFKYDIALFGSRVPNPFLVSPEGWGIFLHQPYYPEFDLREGEAAIQMPSGKGDKIAAVDLFFIHGKQPEKVLSSYTSITGKWVMPPKWSLGYMQSHRTLGGPDEIMEVAHKLRGNKLPCDALIYLGTGYCPAGWNMGHGSFEFNPETFPNPDKQLDQLADMHFKPILHVLKPPQNLHGYLSDRQVNPEDTGHILNYWDKHKGLFDHQISGFWPDIGDALPVESKLARHRMYYKGQLKEEPGIRPYALHRTGYAGMQRYGGWIWSGDVYSTWATLKEQISLGINCSVSGMPYWGTDIGGFVSTSEYTGEMYVRWFQFATFCPSFRSHGRSWHLHTPWGWNTGKIGHVENTPNTMGIGLPPEEELHNENVLPVCRKYLNLRYRLFPYNYNLAWEVRDKGLPFIRPMWLYHPDDEMAIQTDDQYYWGSTMLVAPVYEKNAYKRSVYLPEGEWYDYWTNLVYKGNQVIQKFVGLEIMPLYIKAGAIIPFDPVRQHVNEAVDGPVTIKVYTGQDGSYSLYEDDGNSLDYLDDEYRVTSFQWNDMLKTLTITPDKLMADNKPVTYRVLLMPGEKEKIIEYEHLEKTINF